MSVTPQSSDGTTRQPRAQRALDRFDELLFDNPEICSHCFSRIRDRTEYSEEERRGATLGTGNKPTETLERAGDGTLGQDIREHNKYGTKREYYPRTYCDNCGSPGGTADGSHIHSTQSALGCAYQIVRRLHEMGYYPDIHTLFETVEHLKSKPDKQGQDREIFATAVHLSIERGGVAPAVSAHVESGVETSP